LLQNQSLYSFWRNGYAFENISGKLLVYYSVRPEVLSLEWLEGGAQGPHPTPLPRTRALMICGANSTSASTISTIS